MSHKKEILPWATLESVDVFKNRFFRLRKDRCRLPSGTEMPAYYVFEFSDWVNIVPVTPQGEIVLIEQYRHGSGEIEYEVPGGALNHGGKEDPKEAALRELQEETGFTSSKLDLILSHRPNPALQNNSLHTYIAWDATLLGEQNLDPYEDIAVRAKTVAEVEAMIDQGKIRHSLVLVSLLLSIPKIVVRSENSTTQLACSFSPD